VIELPREVGSEAKKIPEKTVTKTVGIIVVQGKR
jgi:hypothetical protein